MTWQQFAYPDGASSCGKLVKKRFIDRIDGINKLPGIVATD